jgi:hypothetical protein
LRKERATKTVPLISSGEAGVIGLFAVTFGLKVTVFYFVLAMGRASFNLKTK